MNKKELSERDICTKCITPAITGAKWDIMSQIPPEYQLTARGWKLSFCVARSGD